MAEVPLDILRCPVTHGALRPAGDDELAALNARIAAGEIRTRAGAPATGALPAALVSDDGGLAYPVDDGIVALLGDTALVLEGAPAHEGTDLRAEKRAVQAFYDVVGWRQDEDEVFEDTARFVDTRPFVQEYNRECRLRIGRELPARGEYLLDVASGPVQFPEYVAYQDGFDVRLCADFSRLALVSARRNAGDKAVLVQGDITALPFRDGSIDAVLSLHTIYHVPRDEQPTAFKEVHRVLKPGGVAVVAYQWGQTPFRELSPIRRLLHLPARVLQRVVRSIRQRGPSEAPSGDDEPQLYFHAYDYRWFATQDWPFRWEVRIHHLFTSAFLERYVRERLFGRQLLGAIRRVEDRFPKATGRWGRYPLIVIRKD